MAAPELRLNVTLDLAFFRTQVQKLTAIAEGEFRPKLFVKLDIDKKDFEQQLKALEKIKPVITIKDSQVEAAKIKIGTLNKSLATLRRATATPIEIKIKYVEEGKPPTGAISKSGTFRQRLTGLDTEPIKQLYAAAGKAGIVQFDAEIAKNKGKIITALNQAGESSVTGLLNGLKSKDSAVKAAAKSLGDILVAALKLSLQIQSPSKKMEAIGEYAGEGFNKGLKESLSEAKDSAVSKMRELVAALRFEAAKMQNISLAPASLRGAPRGGRGYFNPIGPLPEGSKEQYTMTDRGYQPYLGGPGVGPSAAPRGLLPSASAIGRGFSGQSFGGAPVNFKMGVDLPALPPSGTAERLRQQARVAQAHLRSAERSVTVFGERAAMLEKAMSAFRMSGRAVGYTSPIGPLPRDSAEPYAAGSRGMFGKEGFEARLESRPVSGLLPPSLTPTREQIVAARTQIARQRSDARALDAQLENQIRQTQFRPTVPPRQYFQPNTQPLLPGSGGALALRGGGAPPSPPSGGGRGGDNVPPVPPSSGGRGSGFFGGMQFNMPQLPGAGIVQGLGTEFAFAAKQVLLFGTAYKALAFLTDFPSKVGAAVGQLQSFKNTLKSITPSTVEFGQSSQFILSLVDQYNIPLQSARDGFAKLYASMEPAGFSGKEIRDLFEGVSMGAATFGMSADKVDRVMYAFAQMASKGQVMSEELKGQLGDVLPGSLALFAKAAKMSVSDFSKAMEDGAFKGNAMRELLIKVGSTMKEEFGKGAIGAAVTFQGVMNRLQTSATLFYEAFEPAAVAFANTFVLPLTNGLRMVTDAFTQLLTGQKAITSSGANLAAQIQPLILTFQGIASNLEKAGQAALTVTKSIAPIIKLILQLLASPIVGWLAQVYVSVVLLQGAFILLGGRAILGAITGFAQYSISVARAGLITQTMANQALSARLQLNMLASGAATTGVAMSAFAVAVRTAFITTAAGAVVIAVGMMIAEFMRLRGVMDDIEGRYKSVADQARMMGESGNVGGIQKLQNDAIQQANTYEKILKGLEKAQDRSFGQKKFFAIDKDTADLLKRAGQGSTLTGKNIIKGADIENIKKAIDLNRKNYKENQKIIDEQENKAERKAKELKAGGPGTNIKDSGEDKDKTNLESYYNLEDQLAKAQTQADIDRINAIFEHRKSLINSTYDLEEARANSIQKEAIAHQKAVSSIFLELQKKQIEARLDVLKSQGSVAGGATATEGLAGGAMGSATGAGVIEYFSGDPSRADYQPDHGTVKNYHDHIAFATREIAIAAYKKLTAAGLKVTEFQGFGAGVTGPHSGPGSLHHKGLAMDVPGYQHGGSGPIGPKEYAASARVRAVLGIGGAGSGTAGAGAPRKVPGSEKRDILAEQSVEIAQQRESLVLTHSQEEAQIALNVAKEAYLAQIFGIAEKELQLGQSQKQTALLTAGFTDNEIEDEMKLETLRLKHTAGINEASKAIAFNNALKAQGVISQQALSQRNAYQNDLIDKFNKKLPESIKLQQNLNKAAREYVFAGRIKALANEIQLLTTIGDTERRLLELRQGGLNPKEAQQVYNLEKVKKNLEDTKALIGNFVSSTSSDYKGFLKAVISGEDAADALQKFQEGLTDKVLTIFLDFAMAPVEDMMKKSLEGLFLPKADTSKVQANVAVDANTTATIANTLAIEALTAAKGAGIAPGVTPGAAPGQGVVPIAVTPFGSESLLPAFDFSATDSIFGGLQNQIKASLDSVSGSFTDAAFNLTTSAEPWKQTLITDIPFALSSSNEQIAAQGTTFSEGLTNVVGGIGAAAAGITGIFAGISQIGKGGTSNVLGGIGSILMGAGGAIGGFGKIFGFADGGIPPMNKPSLVGERGPELFVPHSMGTIVPAGPTAGIREAMANGNGQSNASPVLNMSFQTSTINGVEYVSRDQLEAAMMETRRQASRDGAKRGMTMTLDRLQQSPSTRSRVGLG